MADTVMLIGFMGAGKTTVGQQLAQATSQKFLDLDDEFVKETKTSINDFMAEHGEAGFRKMETSILANRLLSPGVISTGGGIIESADNRQIIQNSDAKVIFLQADFATVLQRLSADTDRPLLRKLSMKELLDRWELRQPLYNQVADAVVMTNGKAPRKIVNELMSLLESPDDSLIGLRSQIDSLDRQILRLVSERIDVVKEVADFKKRNGISVVQQDRMDQIRAELKSEFRADGNISDDFVDAMVSLLTSSAIDHENRMIG
ncbi:shikimate kinase [Companilactobacillus zhongbaensis]|uniref:shikimate kinase n=1 Tax=Companilactobacillus zhongbaensis TaxID=2486009 RepID=UPI000F793E34|nr:shikimate kinase [Companilactobacillus zhongbaensis]